MELVPSRYLKKNSNLNFAVDAFLSPLLFILYAIWGKKRKTTCATRKSRTNFFSLILMGPIPFFLTFRAELKKISKKIIRPKMTDSTGNFGFVHKGGEGQQQHTHSKKIEIFQIANRPQWPIPSSVPHWPWLKKMYFRALARALRALRAHRPPNYRSSTIPNVRVCGSSRTELDYFRNEESSVG